MASTSLSFSPRSYQTRLSKERPGSFLNAAIADINMLKGIVGIAPAGLVLAPAIGILTMVKDIAINEHHYVELGLQCADVCKALARSLEGKHLDDLGPHECEAMAQLLGTMDEIEKNVTEKCGRGNFTRMLSGRGDRETVAAWKADLIRVLQVFNTEMAINTNTAVSETQRIVTATRADAQRAISDMHRSMLAARADTRRATYEMNRTIAAGQADTNRALSELHLNVSATQAHMRQVILATQASADRMNAFLVFSVMLMSIVLAPDALRRPVSGLFLLVFAYFYLTSRVGVR